MAALSTQQNQPTSELYGVWGQRFPYNLYARSRNLDDDGSDDESSGDDFNSETPGARRDRSAAPTNPTSLRVVQGHTSEDMRTGASQPYWIGGQCSTQDGGT